MQKSKNPPTYSDAGVDLNAGDRLVEEIAPLARKTHGPQVLAGLGGFGALFDLGALAYKEPILVSGTDGVGTKVLLADALDRLDTVGIDLVAMCVNDILTLGAKPLFFLDYLAMGKLNVERGVALIKGIAAGCLEAGCALIGGETAEMPGVYSGSEFDLAGFAVGVVEKSLIIDGKKIKTGDALVGLASNGLHSNGYSLVRRVLLGTSDKLDAAATRERLAERPPELGNQTLADAALAPTRIYVKAVEALRREVPIHGLAHITGAGLPGNLPRILPEGTQARLRASSWLKPPIFELLRVRGKLEQETLFETFNMGIGMVAIVPAAEAERARRALEAKGVSAFLIGEIARRGTGESDFVFVD